MALVPGYEFDGLLILRGDDGYDRHAYQYATTSYNNKNNTENPLSPGYIFYALHDKDVKTAISFARDGIPKNPYLPEFEGILPRALAIRTGGHQYSGASSTSGDNMVLDMSKAYLDFKWKNQDKTLVKVGVSLPLGQLNHLLRSEHRFVPHGQCAFVHLGGHCQTGGYGQFMRSFGFLTDHVMQFRLINAKGEVVKVARDSKDFEMQDLFYALSGGSPGNLGVVTHVTLKVHKDKDHPKSLGFRAAVKYNSEILKKLLDIIVEMGEKNVSAEYDVVITMMSKREQVPPPFDSATIIVFAQRANLHGNNREPDPWFTKLRSVFNGHPGSVFTDSNEIPLSTLSSHWLFPIDREMELPYIKGVAMTKAPASYLKDKNWSQWVCNRIDELEVPSQDLPNQDPPKQKCFAVAQFAYTGGTGNSTPATVKNDDGKTALSWRDSTFLMVMDCFYTPDDDGKSDNKAAAQAWSRKNILEATGIDPTTGEKTNDRDLTPTFSEFEDRRLLWGSHDQDLVANAKFYYDNKEKFERLVNIKKHQDPQGIFSANKFCVVHRPSDPPAMDAKISAPLRRSMFMKGPILHTELAMTHSPILKRVEDLTGFGRQPGSLEHEE
ncbi:hypothetical protein BGZ92_010555 [Podila epicladia]|nr:hypothetical protein BGZ92_010555 [Podila epicladia]